MSSCYQNMPGFSLLFLFLLLHQIAFAQERTISGKVTSAGETLPGVSVVIKGTGKAVSSDASGNYRINVSNGDILVFSYIGYTPKEAAVSAVSGNELNVVLESSVSELQQVVVVGYGTQRKSDVSGSVVSVKPDAMNAIPTTSISEMLRGKAAGVQITTESSRPGGSSNILIRGQRSLSGGNAPLYIVDNVPVNNINDINSADIASVEILKDAASQAIYGTRAANGVILITTKRGASGKIAVDYTGYTGIQQLKKNFSLYNGNEWAAMRREAFRTENAAGNYESDAVVFDKVALEVLNSGNAIDWQKFMISDAWSQKHDISVRGGGDKTQVAASLGYFNQQGMVDGSGFLRGTGRMNVDQKINNKISVGANLSFTRSKISQEDGNLNEYIITSPLAKPYDANGNLQLFVNGENTTNPKFLNEQTLNENTTNRLLFNVFGNVDLFKGFRYRVNANVNTRNNEAGTYRTKAYLKGSNIGNAASISSGNYNDYLIENILSYNRNFAEKHLLDVTLLQSVYKEVGRTTSLSGSNIPTDLLSYNGLPSAQTTAAPGRSVTDRTLLSYMGRLRYTLLDKYLFTVTTRIDGSTVFGPSNKYGVFPSASFAWKMEQEKFLENAAWVDQLKLRVNYGQVGNQAVSPYTTLGEVNSYPFLFGDGSFQTGYLPNSQLSNPNLKWETTTSLNLGVDFGFFNSRITGALEYYNTDTKDLLVSKSINQSLGYSSVLMNLGKVNNKGVEMQLSTTPVRKKDFTWGVDLTFTANRNKLVKITGDVDAAGNPINDLNNNWFIGKPINVYYNYIFDGIWQTGDNIAGSHMPAAKPGDIRVKDLNGDNKIDANDRDIIFRDPKWYGSLGTTLKYKAFDMLVDFYTVQGSVRSNPYLYDFNSGGSLSGKNNGIKVDYWTPENPSNTFPRPRFSSTILYFSALGYQDNSYIQFRSATLGYTLPGKILSPVGIKKARAYVTGNNLFFKTDYSSYNPEVTAGGYPDPRTFLFGLNVSF
ncbi:SusC/RagA family TonB-linked outer membrane protein [Hufsiella ginkgonis]|uniref:SusC/RagA family TonB-linked outer membrane protein n=1 Tax=Hufsiella ginkgonis TaxID=2695274 RepID=A0A7K1XXQ6_9SPHI|nr:TonB-dependent receptor [Hufsiella ginkgonis]MXV15780.1 SusC/RagA family TonB-linked outer membrane protein [Hufsiella ginkgonis]